MTITTQPNTLIVGGTRGIGRVLADLLIQEKHSVSIIGRTPPEKLQSGISFYRADLLKPRIVKNTLTAIVAEQGGFNHLVFLQRLKDKAADWDNELTISLSATKQIIEFALEHFSANGDKSIVLTSSIAAQRIAEEQAIGYHIAKAGLVQMARYFAVTAGRRGIRVNVVSPGTIVKPENEVFYRRDRRLQKLFKAIVPLGRMGTAVEVAQVIAFFCSPKASFVTGQHIMVDGGVNLLAPETLARKIIDLKN
jgi:NAD(P)-dependent dehydrogenase (short-subunit alcohol dehydrogenase family)